MLDLHKIYRKNGVMESEGKSSPSDHWSTRNCDHYTRKVDSTPGKTMISFQKSTLRNS